MVSRACRSAALAAGCLAGVVVLGVFTFAPNVTALSAFSGVNEAV
jgi:hypothetical protein